MADEDSLSSLRVRIDGVRDLSNERHAFYLERHNDAKEAHTAAIKSLRELTDQAFDAAKIAMEKAEGALKEYKATSNEFRGTLADQANTLMPRPETESLIKQLREAIDRLAETSRASRDSMEREFTAKIEAIKTEIQGLRETRTAVEARDRYTDPQLSKLVTAVEMLQAKMTSGEGQRQGISKVGFGVMSVLTALSLLIGGGAAIYSFTRSSVPVAPVYAPVPGGQQPVPK